jgi:hypothetical protein
MQWSDVTAPPNTKTLRQFAGLCLIFAAGLAGWRLWHGSLTTPASVVSAVGTAIGVIGLARPAAVRPIYAGWMIAVFPIGWTVSRLMIALMFFAVFTPVALMFRMVGRDALQLKRTQRRTHWSPKAAASDAATYLRQS